jgi:hypothetical protein
MASFRKRYQDELAQSPTHKNAPAVASTPVQAAEPPPPAEAPKPLEEIQKPSAADDAAANAIKQRLNEMDRAESLAQQQAANHPRLAAEPQQPQQPADRMEQAIAAMPERVKRWFRAHPEYLVEPEKAAQIQYCHHVAARETGEQFTDPYFDRMEQMLGWQQQPPATKTAPTQDNKVNGHAPVSAPAEPRNPAPVRQQQRPGPSVSAPPTRTTPSMTTGKPLTSRPALTNEEVMLAASLKISPEEYAQQKEKMRAMQASRDYSKWRQMIVTTDLTRFSVQRSLDERPTLAAGPENMECRRKNLLGI